MAKYLVFLNWLLSLRQYAPAIIAALQALYEALKPVLESPPSGEGSLQMVAETRALVDDKEVPAEVLEAEGDVLALTAQEGTRAIGDGSRLRNIFAMLQMLLKLFGG